MGSRPQWFVTIAFLLGLGVADAQPPKPLRDVRQFRFGFEPTVTNLPILLESGGAVVKKMITGKGDGVLSADLPVSVKYRERYLSQIREECPECKITEARESHGELTYHIEFPDGYYIRSSLDAGALEWQTKPSTLSEIKEHLPRIQKEVFDLSKKAGMNLRIEATGGHVTFSGFGNDTFWYGNYLKYRARNADLDWGFFGKDGYNATPVGLWQHEQQVRYEKVHVEHDQKWEKFLKELEAAVARGASEAEVMKIYKNREVMTIQEYSARLLEIYHNPKLENKRLGKRSKPKYVANKPYKDMIENRAIRPQKSADELLKLSEFIEAEAWYVKEKMNSHLEVPFIPNSFSPSKKKVATRNARKVIESLGLDWKDYVKFSKTGDTQLLGSEKDIAEDFKPKEYGAAKRDELFKKIRDRFAAKQVWTPEESAFMSDLMNEMSYTVQDAELNTKMFSQKASGEMITRMSPRDANQVVGEFKKLSDKFPAASNTILSPVQETMKTYILRSLQEVGLTESRSVLPLVERKKEILTEVMKLHQASVSAPQLGLYADLVLSESQGEKEYLEAIIKKKKSGLLTEIPPRFHEVAMKAKDQALAEQATSEVVEWLADAGKTLRVLDEDAELFHWLAKKRPEFRDRLFIPLRNHYLTQIKKNEFGLKNFYQTTIYYDFLLEITPAAEKQKFLQSMLERVRAMDQIKNDPDSKAFIERIESHLAPVHTESKGVPCGLRFMGHLKQMFSK